MILIFSLLHTQNIMEQLAYLEGENVSDGFGKFLTSLDFNGDGYDDLVVVARGWQPTGNTSVGKIYCYFGGVIFNTEVDFIIPGSIDSIVRYQVTNLGDLNSDGFEDLGLMRETNNDLLVKIILGNNEVEIIPDFEQSFSKEYYDVLSLRKLGDINNDGFDDAGLVARGIWLFQTPYPTDFYFIYGNDNSLNSELFYSLTLEGASNSFCGVGDVNNDEYSDFCIGYTYEINDTVRHTNTLYYGSENIGPEPDLVLWDFEYTNMTLGLPVGDTNADGYADFAGHLTTTTEYNIRIWYGQEVITQECDLLLNYGSGGDGFGYAFDYGDINNDGYSDIAVGSPGGGLNGKAYLYLGGENPNNTYDYEFEEPPGVNHDYGTSLTIGKFDGDLFDDVAISGPLTGSGQNHGYVYIFAGNGEMEDMVGTDENEIITLKNIIFANYPNPFNPSTTISFNVTQTSSFVTLDIYNIKGQQVRNFLINSSTDQSINSVIWNGTDENNKPVSSGIYLYQLNVDGEAISSKKCLLLK